MDFAGKEWGIMYSIEIWAMYGKKENMSFALRKMADDIDNNITSGFGWELVDNQEDFK